MFSRGLQAVLLHVQLRHLSVWAQTVYRSSFSSPSVCQSCLRLLTVKFTHKSCGFRRQPDLFLFRQIHVTVAYSNFNTGTGDTAATTEQQNYLKETDKPECSVRITLDVDRNTPDRLAASSVQGSDSNKPDSEVVLTETEYESDDVDVVEYVNDDVKNVEISRPIKKQHSYRNFGPLVKKSPVLSYLLLMGVNLWKIQKTGHAGLLLRLNMKENVIPLLFVLHNAGIGETTQAKIITKHPVLFEEDVDDVEVRLNYLRSKRFTEDMIEKIVVTLPSILSTSTVDIDSKLGFYQNTLKLKGEQLRQGVVTYPLVMKCDKDKFLNNTLILRRMLGFESEDLRNMFMKNSEIFTLQPQSIVETYTTLHNNFGLDDQMIKKFPALLTGDMNFMMIRHKYLVTLGRAQYDPKKVNYVPPDSLSRVDDDEFLRNVAKSSKADYHNFLKSL